MSCLLFVAFALGGQIITASADELADQAADHQMQQSDAMSGGMSNAETDETSNAASHEILGDGNDTENSSEADSLSNANNGGEAEQAKAAAEVKAADAASEGVELLVEAALSKYSYSKTWNEKWGDYPDDGTNPDDYVYYVWKLSAKVTGASCQYTLTWDLGTLEGSTLGIIEGPGEIMGWRRGYVVEFTGDKGHSYDACDITRTNPTAEAKTTNLYVLTRFKRSEIPVGGQTIKMQGRVTYQDVNGIKKTLKKTHTRKNEVNKYLLSDYTGPSNFKINKDGTTMTISWEKDPRNDGYVIDYSTSRLFYSHKTVSVKDRYGETLTLNNLKESKPYYVRIRSYKTLDGTKYKSRHTFSSNMTSALTVKKTTMKYNGSKFELRKRAGQKMFAYDTVQGGCTDGTYAYYTLYDRVRNNCKVAKVKLSTMKVVKVSKPLGARHGNGMTYNPNNNRLYITHTTNEGRKITIVNASTLKVTSRKTISIPSTLKGNTSYQKSKGYNFAGISYNPDKKRYVVLLANTGRFLILNSSLKPLEIIKPSKSVQQLKQSLCATGEYIMVLSSPASGRWTNILQVYDWDGSYISTVTMTNGYEAENVFSTAGRTYVTSYHSYYKSYKVKVKKYKRIKKTNSRGKTYYVKKAYYKTVTKKKLLRDNYVYRLNCI